MSAAPRHWIRLLTFFAAMAAARAQTGISIRVVQGDGAINSIRMRRGHDPVVQVVRADGEPLGSANVTFLLPASGAGATFPTGASLTTQTDAHGMAVGRGLVPNRVEGQFRIRVTASARNDSANATITQTNAEPAAKSSRSKWIAIAAVVGGAAAGGIALAAHGGGSSPPAGAATGSTSSGGAIVPGAPSFGPPH